MLNIRNKKTLTLLKHVMNIRQLSKNVACHNNLFFENLSVKRSLIRLSGEEVYGFVQGLITNDVLHLKRPADCAIFTMFLNKQGRVLCDSIIYKYKNNDSMLLIECDQEIQNKLKQHLIQFRVRKKITIESADEELNIWTNFADSRCENGISKTSIVQPNEKLHEQVLACSDPRLNQLGMRLITPNSFNIENFKNMFENKECALSESNYNYTEHRYVHGVSEGIIEIPTLQIFPFEANCDYLHGISLHKGCYLGQEFTARTYHTGVIRKRIMPLRFDKTKSINDIIDYDSPILNENDSLVGKIRGVQNQHAIGSLKVDKALSSKYLKVGDILMSTLRPTWWPRNQS